MNKQQMCVNENYVNKIRKGINEILKKYCGKIKMREEIQIKIKKWIKLYDRNETNKKYAYNLMKKNMNKHKIYKFK